MKDEQKRFGQNAIEKEFITKEQLIEALSYQVKENVEAGLHRKIGAILFEMEYLDAVQVKQVLDCRSRHLA